ncbi:protein TolR [Taklimakanibacter albus]|uniref:Protein TolR n=1 Tax=Taklimakanibacter albus TaxID=2800327 RepID=A0ACC5R5B3_9HYPH|nr:protein TolR [Aestuariivirga sp. YIM B02566]MBK1867768.1 protein TolR [Aestuariivirga sp. YIM B02566]
MGASAGGTSGGYTRRGSRRRSSFSAMSEINVTPLVDVMLVLLIVFMVAAPLMTVGVPVDLPQTKAKPMQGDTEPITVSVDAEGKIFIQETQIDQETLIAKLQAIAKNGYEERIFVRADTNVNYGLVMKVMGELNGAGFKKIGLVTSSETVAPDKGKTQKKAQK